MFLLALLIAEGGFFLDNNQQPDALYYSKRTSYTSRWCTVSYIEILPPQKLVRRSVPSLKLPAEISRTRLCVTLSCLFKAQGKPLLAYCATQNQTCTFLQDQASIALASIQKESQVLFFSF